MISPSIAIALLVSFLSTILLMPKFIKFLRNTDIVGRDIQKKGKPKIAEMGGPAVVAGFLAGIFMFIWIKVFLYGELANLVEIFAAISTILIIGMIGVFDDLSCLQRKREDNEGLGKFKRVGLKKWQKPLLTLPAAIPLMAIMAGDSSITIPLLGPMNVGILYPLVLVPIGVIGASNATNMLAGFNGLEAGLGFILITTLGLYSLFYGNPAASVIALTFATALLAFLKYNWYPAKILPGDSLVYAIGATVAVIAIVGNIEKFALYCFALWFIEFFLKLRSRFKAQSFGILQKDGTLKAPYEKVYSIPHAIMKLGRFKEYQIVLIILGLQILVEIAVFMFVRV